MQLSINPSNCWEPLTADNATAQRVIAFANAKKLSDWAISSKASMKIDECSTTSKINRNASALVKLPRMGGFPFDIISQGYINISMADRKLFASKKELVQKYDELKSAGKMAFFYGVCKKTIYVWFEKYEIETNKKISLKKHINKYKKLIDKNLTRIEIAKKLNIHPGSIIKLQKLTGLKPLDKHHKGFSITHGGYKMVKCENHPFCDSKGYVREHRLVVEKYLGRTLKDREIIHHIDGNKLNNKIENLEIMTRKEHVKHHGLTRWK